jgi:hypothetical protein
MLLATWIWPFQNPDRESTSARVASSFGPTDPLCICNSARYCEESIRLGSLEMNQLLVLLAGIILLVTAFVRLRTSKSEKRWMPDIRRAV